ncbi:unnamed protein product [Urochloa humidicola]
MDCCICSPMASMYRLPRNAICAPCYEGAKAIIGFLNKDEQEDGSVKSRGSMKPNSSTMGMGEAWVKVKEMRDREETTNQRADFLEQGLALAWKEGMHTDIVVKPGGNGAPIAAHKAILAARSEVFRHMLSGEEQCIKAPAGESISLPELSHDELYLLLSFLYTGGGLDDVPVPERHLHALLVAADKYDVAFLRRACEARLAARVDARNALRTLEVADLSSSTMLRERAMDTVLEHAQQVVFSPEYEDFAVRNAGLCVEITRALLAKTIDVHGDK